MPPGKKILRALRHTSSAALGEPADSGNHFQWVLILTLSPRWPSAMNQDECWLSPSKSAYQAKNHTTHTNKQHRPSQASSCREEENVQTYGKMVARRPETVARFCAPQNLDARYFVLDVLAQYAEQQRVSLKKEKQSTQEPLPGETMCWTICGRKGLPSANERDNLIKRARKT